MSDALAANIGKNRTKRVVGTVEPEEQAPSLGAEMSSRISPDGSVSALSDPRGVNSLILDFKEEH